MPRTTLDPITEITRDIPADVAATTPAELDRLKEGVREILEGLSCHCNGEAVAKSSVQSVIAEIIRATAVARGIEAAIREVALSRNADPASSPAALATTLEPDEVNALVNYVSGTMTPDKIESLMSNSEMAEIETAQIAKVPGIRDPGWPRDIANIVGRVIPHGVTSWDEVSGLYLVENVSVKLDTLSAEVDDNGEICCWTYEESVI